MSRIHEALKRAEQQRTVPLDVPPILPEVHGHVAEPLATPPPETPDSLAHSKIDTRTRAGEFLRDPPAPPAVREQFRTLRSRLYQVRDKQPLRSVLVTSSLLGEGKTFVANNLAHALARQQNCRVLLIDADLRRPDLHPGFGAPSSPGLSEYLRGKAPELTVIQRGLPEYLCFIAGGSKPQNPAELIANGRLKSLLQTIGPVFDWVILDSPPTLPVSDAVMLAEFCDGVLTVIRAAQTGFDSAQKSCQQLRDKNLLGVALNCAEEGAAYGSYYGEELKTEVAN